MKKAKIMLMAIAVLAIVGGAVAFKAKNNFNPIVFGSKCNTAHNVCSLGLVSSRIIATDDASKPKVTYAPQTQTCLTDADCFTYSAGLNP